jgi:hypothetical protein
MWAQCGKVFVKPSQPEQSVWWLMGCRSFHPESQHTCFCFGRMYPEVRPLMPIQNLNFAWDHQNQKVHVRHELKWHSKDELFDACWIARSAKRISIV